MPIHPLTGVATNNCYSIWGRFRTCIYCQQCCQHVSKSGLRKATVITGSQNSTVLSGPTLAKLGRTRFDLRSLYVTTGGALLSPINGAFIELIKSVYPFNDGSFAVGVPATLLNCGSSGSGVYLYVTPGQNAVTLDGAKSMLATLLTAFALGHTVQIAYDNSTSNCYVNRLLIQ